MKVSTPLKSAEQDVPERAVAGRGRYRSATGRGRRGRRDRHRRPGRDRVVAGDRDHGGRVFDGRGVVIAREHRRDQPRERGGRGLDVANRSEAWTSKVWRPGSSPAGSTGLAHGANAASSRRHSIPATEEPPLSAASKTKVARLARVGRIGVADDRRLRRGQVDRPGRARGRCVDVSCLVDSAHLEGVLAGGQAGERLAAAPRKARTQRRRAGTRSRRAAVPPSASPLYPRLADVEEVTTSGPEATLVSGATVSTVRNEARGCRVDVAGCRRRRAPGRCARRGSGSCSSPGSCRPRNRRRRAHTRSPGHRERHRRCR